jgi:hypothetical protein
MGHFRGSLQSTSSTFENSQAGTPSTDDFKGKKTLISFTLVKEGITFQTVDVGYTGTSTNEMILDTVFYSNGSKLISKEDFFKLYPDAIKVSDRNYGLYKLFITY